MRIVRALPAEASGVAAVLEGLAGLDSGALAALLKELAKGGLGKRAIEIFDWLRSLDERSEFGSLCDVYTCVQDPRIEVMFIWPACTLLSIAIRAEPLRAVHSHIQM